MDKLSPYFIRRTQAPLEEEEIVLDESLEGGDDETPRFWEYWRIVKKRRWLIALCAVTGVMAMGLYGFTRIPLYTAKSTILIEKRGPQVVGMQDAFSPLADSLDKTYEQTQFEILRRAAFAARTIRESGLENNPLFTGGDEAERKGLWQNLSERVSGWVGDAVMSFRRQEWVSQIFPLPPEVGAEDVSANARSLGVKPALVRGYLEKLRIQPVRRTNLVEISFTTEHPVLSALLANAHAESYLRYGMDLRTQANQEAMVFLEDKLLELKDRVEQSEAALNSYRREKGIITLDEKGNLVVDRLVDLNERLTEAEAARIALESEVRLIRRGNYDALPRVRQSGIISSLKSKLGGLEAEYANLAGEFKPGYPPLDTLKLKVDEVRRRLDREIQAEVKAIRSAYQAAKNNEEQLRDKMDQQKTAALNLKDAAVQYAILAREVDTNRQLYDSVLERMKEMGVAAQVRESNASVVEQAMLPNFASYPNKTRLLILGLFLGVAGGVGLAFFLDHIDTTLKTPDEVERYLNLPNLVVVPDFVKMKSTSNGYLPAGVSNRSVETAWNGANGVARDLVLTHHPRSVVAESYRSLRTAILLSRPGSPPRTILFTSASSGEGKTTTAVNTSVIFAQMGYRVIILDADLRRPRGHRVLGLDNEVGLTEFLTGQSSSQQVTTATSEENLFFVGSGAEPPNPSELLSSRKMKQFLSELQEEYDCIIIDSSPIMPVSDPLLISTMVEGVVLVVDSQNTPKQLVRDARARLKKANAKILGVVLNRVNIRDGDYGHYYKHYYSYYHQA